MVFPFTGRLYSSHELKELVSYEIEVVTETNEINLLKEVKVLLVTTDVDEYHAALSYFTPPLKDGIKLFQYERYIIGQYGLFKVAQCIANFQETDPEKLVLEANEIFKNLGAIISLGVLRGVKRNNVKGSKGILVSETLSLYEPPNNITKWTDIMYLPSPFNTQFEKLLSKWSHDCSIANQLSRTPHCCFGNILCGTEFEITKSIIDEYPDVDGIDNNDLGFFYKGVLNQKCNLMIVKAVCGFINEEERDYFPTAALLAADFLNYFLKDGEIFRNWSHGEMKDICYI